MAKNPVFEFLRQQGHMRAPRATPLIGRAPDPKSSRFAQAPFTYFGSRFVSDDALLETLAQNQHPLAVVADSSLFAPSRLDLCRRLLIQTPVHILPEVRSELADLERHKSAALRNLVLPDGKLNSRLIAMPDRMLAGYDRVATKYVNLLHLRKRLLEKPTKDFEDARGQAPAGQERAKLGRALLNDGISWRTLSLSNKGDVARRYTDEALVATAVLGPTITGRDVVLLTADRDVFDQFFQLTQLIHSDYGSFLLGEDFRRHPDRYKHQHAVTTPFMRDGAMAVGRESDPLRLLPSTAAHATCASWVIDVASGHFLTWVSTRDVARALSFQNTADGGRVADAGEGRNAHIHLNDPACKESKAHFTIGTDVLAVDNETSIGRLCISEFDFFRAVVDGPVGIHDRRGVVMPGLPRW
jgi:hypothetical protein